MPLSPLNAELSHPTKTIGIILSKLAANTLLIKCINYFY